MMTLLEEIPKLTDPCRIEELRTAIDKFVTGIQVLLEHEWERAENEAKGRIE
jgi:hypothetical protein